MLQNKHCSLKISITVYANTTIQPRNGYQYRVAITALFDNHDFSGMGVGQIKKHMYYGRATSKTAGFFISTYGANSNTNHLISITTENYEGYKKFKRVISYVKGKRMAANKENK